MQLELEFVGGGGPAPLSVEVTDLVVAGWTGRDAAAMEHHIRELEAIGVRRPASTPTFYRVAAHRLTTEPAIQCTGRSSSGEAETVILAHGGKLYVGLGSDHTDREVEAYGITVSKQMCDKPLARQVWAFEDVADHWDRLILRSWVEEDGQRVLYQEGTVAGLLDPRDLISRYTGGTALPDGTAIMGGTMPALGGVRASGTFEAELEDPVLSRRLRLAYRIDTLAVAELAVPE